MKRISRVLAMIAAATLLVVGAGELTTSVQAKTKKVKKTKKRKAKKGTKLVVVTAGVTEHAMLKTYKKYEKAACKCKYRPCADKLKKAMRKFFMSAKAKALWKKRPTRAQRRALFQSWRKRKSCLNAAKYSKKDLKVMRHLTMANHFLRKEKNMKLAAAQFKAILKLNKKHERAAGALIGMRLKAKDWKGADKLLRKYMKQLPKSRLLMRMRSWSYVKTGKLSQAVTSYESLLKTYPGDLWSRWQLYNVLLGKYRKGDASVRGTLEKQTATFLRRNRYRKGWQYRSAERTLTELRGGKKALEIYDAINAYDMAWSSRRMRSINQQMAKARTGFEACLKRDPNNLRCRYYMGLVYSSVKASAHYDYKKAKAEFAKVTSGQYAIDAAVHLARAARKEGDMSTAVNVLKKALKTRPNHPRANLELGIVYKLEGRDEDAVQAYVRAIRAGRWSSTSKKAQVELATVQPDHPMARRAWATSIEGKVFNTERYRTALASLERRFGGVVKDAPEAVVLEKILSRILAAADVPPEMHFKVHLLKSGIVNAMATPSGAIYFTKGMFSHLKKRWPDTPLDENNDILGHIMAHEVVHVLRRHTVRSVVFRAAMKDARNRLDGGVLTAVTRIHEIEADREGIVLGFLAGYHPRGGIRYMEARGQEREIPTHRTHPTYDERIHLLEEYWSNDVKYGWKSFTFGLNSLEKARKAEMNNDVKLVKHYRKAVDHFKRYIDTLKTSREVSNNLGLSYAKLGLLLMGNQASPLNRWQTAFSVEKALALKYVSVRKASGAESRSAGEAGGVKKVRIPWELTRAVAILEGASKKYPHYTKTQFNLAMVYMALGRVDDASKVLDKVAGSATLHKGRLGLLRGVILAEKKSYEKAAQSFQKALKMADTKRAAMYNLAHLHALAGRSLEAKKAYQAYVAKYPKGAWSDAARKAITKL